MRWILPSLLAYGFCFFLGYMVRISFQESHYPVAARKAAVKAQASLKWEGSALRTRSPAPPP